MKSHTDALRLFTRRLAALLLFRCVVRWVTAWFFVWGVVVLAARIGGVTNVNQLALGLLGALPLAAFAALVEYRKRAAPLQIRAAYDGLNRLGGVIMAGEVAEMAAWQERLPGPAVPTLRWRSGRAVGILAAGSLFAVVTLCLPERLTTFSSQHPLEIGKLISDLHAEVETLRQEKILEPKKADELQQQLAQLKEQSSAADPNKTWEALDHLKESNTDLARQAAEEALTKTAGLTEAQALASALQAAGEAGLGQDTATRAAQELAGMLKAARLEEGLLHAEFPPELLSQLDGLNKADLAKLLAAIQFNKSALGKTLTNLANLKLIDPKSLSECKNAGECPNPDALAAFLCQNTNGGSLAMLAASYCNGAGVNRGRGDAPMTWKDESSADGAKFKEEALPPSRRLSDAQFVGVSRSAPELSDDGVAAGHGALAGAAGSGGTAHSQAVLPRHKQAVQRFFKREP